MLVAKVVIKSVAMKKIRIKRRSLFVTGSMEMKQPCAVSKRITLIILVRACINYRYMHSTMSNGWRIH